MASLTMSIVQSATAERMTKAFPDEPQLNFLTDFAEDCAERRAAELMGRDKNEDEAA